MFLRFCTSALTVSLWIASAAAIRAGEPTITGLWKTVDDKTGKPRGIVRIYETKGRYYGRIESSLDPAEAKERCEKCPGDRKNQPIIGLLIVREMENRGDDYGGGDILDPESGIVYRCRMQLLDHGRKLRVRGYIGMSIFGRDQVWLREQ